MSTNITGIIAIELAQLVIPADCHIKNQMIFRKVSLCLHFFIFLAVKPMPGFWKLKKDSGKNSIHYHVLRHYFITFMRFIQLTFYIIECFTLILKYKPTLTCKRYNNLYYNFILQLNVLKF